MSNLKGLKLGGDDDNLTTPPSGPAKEAEDSTNLENVESEVEEEVEEVQEVEQVQEAQSDEPAVRWSSHPIARYCIGDFHFENGLLVLQTSEEADAFQKVYESLPVYEQCRLTKLDVSAAEAIVRERIANGGGATKVIDSSVGDRAPNGAVGTGDLLS
jgi:hypothetical protein